VEPLHRRELAVMALQLAADTMEACSEPASRALGWWLARLRSDLPPPAGQVLFMEQNLERALEKLGPSHPLAAGLAEVLAEVRRVPEGDAEALVAHLLAAESALRGSLSKGTEARRWHVSLPPDPRLALRTRSSRETTRSLSRLIEVLEALVVRLEGLPEREREGHAPWLYGSATLTTFLGRVMEGISAGPRAGPGADFDTARAALEVLAMRSSEQQQGVLRERLAAAARALEARVASPSPTAAALIAELRRLSGG
jgi:hypothetical protein